MNLKEFVKKEPGILNSATAFRLVAQICVADELIKDPLLVNKVADGPIREVVWAEMLRTVIKEIQTKDERIAYLEDQLCQVDLSCADSQNHVSFLY